MVSGRIVMKTCIVVVNLLILSATLPAQDRGLGLGLVLGSPTGFSAKYWTARDEAMQFGVGWVAMRKDNGTAISFDYIWHSFDAIRASERFPLFYGFGAQMVGSSLGIRGVFGLGWHSRKTPVDIFIQVGPIIQLTDNSGLYFDAAVGVRYFF
jgi:hypothetical protein